MACGMGFALSANSTHYYNMATAICKYCGGMVSENAHTCPHCGAALDEAPANGVQQSSSPASDAAPQGADQPGGPAGKPTPGKKRNPAMWWIISMVLLILILGAAFTYYKFSQPDEALATVGGDSLAQQPAVEDTMVHITPEFIEAVRKYEELGEFAERLAPVMRNGKWGYINVRGEEVIACQYDKASIFSEGKAAVSNGGEWAYINHAGEVVIPYFAAFQADPFSEGRAFVLISAFDGADRTEYKFIDPQGNRVFGGIIIDDSGLGYMEYPSFDGGTVSIYEEFDSGSTTYNLQGEKVDRPDYVREDKRKYESFSEWNEDTEGFSGLKDSSGKVIIPAKYHEILFRGARTDAPYGVVLAAYYSEYADDYSGGEGGAAYSTKMNYGYVDLEGNDTFAGDIPRRCNDARRRALKKMEEEAARSEELRQRRNALIGIWALSTDYGPICLVFGYDNKYKMYSPHTPVLTKSYELMEDGTVLLNGGKGYMYFRNGTLIGADGIPYQKISDDGNGVPQFN